MLMLDKRCDLIEFPRPVVLLVLDSVPSITSDNFRERPVLDVDYKFHPIRAVPSVCSQGALPVYIAVILRKILVVICDSLELPQCHRKAKLDETTFVQSILQVKHTNR
jgi:hypothetical protein